MRRLARLAVAALMLAGLAACETTGDPRQGGLFGWSESKAQDRQAQKKSSVTGAASTLARENTRGETLQSQDTTASQRLSSANTQRLRTEERLRAQQARLVTKAEKLEADSPTDSGASRARSYRLKVNTIAAQTSIPSQQRAERLHLLEAEIDAALARSSR